MTTITSIAALFGCILLHSFIFTSTAAVVPDSDLPFEFNHDRGSIITEDNVLTQSVSSDGKTVFKTNEPQPIKKYQSFNINTDTNDSPTNQNQKKKHSGNYKAVNSVIEYPDEHTSTSFYSSSPTMNNQWKFIEHFNKLFPGFNNIFTSTAAVVPDSDLPFEFNHDRGSIITEDNVLTQSVSSDGKTVFKTNEPQPIKKYQSFNINTDTNDSPTNQNQKKKHSGNYKAVNSVIEYPDEHTSTSFYSSSPTMNNQWKFIEHFNKLFPGFNNVRIVYV